MNRRFAKYMRVVGAGHVGLLVIMLTTSGLTGIFERKHKEAWDSVEFVIEVPGEPVKNANTPFKEPEQMSEAEEPKETVNNATTVSNVTPLKRSAGTKKNPAVIRSTKKISRTKSIVGGGGAAKTRFTRKEIEDFMAMGAKMGNHTVIPGDEETRCRAIIKNAMDAAWNQPSREDVGNSVAEVTIGLSRDGLVTWRKMSKKSGNTLFDDSVMQAVESVQAIEHLTPAFLDKFREVKVTFELE